MRYLIVKISRRKYLEFVFSLKKKLYTKSKEAFQKIEKTAKRKTLRPPDGCHGDEKQHYSLEEVFSSPISGNTEI